MYLSLMHTFILGLHGGMYIYFDLFFLYIDVGRSGIRWKHLY